MLVMSLRSRNLFGKTANVDADGTAALSDDAAVDTLALFGLVLPARRCAVRVDVVFDGDVTVECEIVDVRDG